MSTATFSEPLESAIIEVWSSDPTMPNRKLRGIVQSREKKTLTVTAAEEIATSAEIRVQTKDLLTLGQVQRCTSGTDATWTVHIGITRSMLVV